MSLFGNYDDRYTHVPKPTLEALIKKAAEYEKAKADIGRLSDRQLQALKRIGELQAKVASGEKLVSPEEVQLTRLKQIVEHDDGIIGEFHVDEELLARRGPKWFERFIASRDKLEQMTQALKASNDELQREVDLIQKKHPITVPGATYFSPDNMTKAGYLSTPGTYIVEVVAGGKVSNVYNIDANRIADFQRVLAEVFKPNNKTQRSRTVGIELIDTSSWTEFADFFNKPKSGSMMYRSPGTRTERAIHLPCAFLAVHSDSEDKAIEVLRTELAKLLRSDVTVKAFNTLPSTIPLAVTAATPMQKYAAFCFLHGFTTAPGDDEPIQTPLSKESLENLGLTIAVYEGSVGPYVPS